MRSCAPKLTSTPLANITMDSTLNLKQLAAEQRHPDATLGRPIAHDNIQSGHENRVVLYLSLVVLMSGVDLVLTLSNVMHGTMYEANPVARALMIHFGPIGLIALKTLSVGFAVGVLY